MSEVKHTRQVEIRDRFATFEEALAAANSAVAAPRFQAPTAFT
jgi:hypothetical protein